MKTLFMYAATICIAAGISLTATAQKKPLDHSVYDSWQHIAQTAITPDGNVIAYEVAPQEGDSETIIKNLTTQTSITIPRATGLKMSKDCKWAICDIKAPFADTRQAKIDKKKPDQMPKDSLAYINLETLEVIKLASVTKYKLPQQGRFLIAYEGKAEVEAEPKPADKTAKASTENKANTEASEAKEAKGTKETQETIVATQGKEAPADTTKKKAPKKDNVNFLVILDPATGQADSLRKASDFAFSPDGSKIAVTYKKDKKDSLTTDKIALYSLPGMEETILDEGHPYYTLPAFSIKGDKLTFLASADTNATGSKHCAVFLTEEITKGKGRKAVKTLETREIIPQDYTTNLPAGWCIPTTAAPKFSADGGKIFLGVAESIPPKDTTLIDFETAQLDIWSWDVYMTPPMQKSNASRIANATCKSVINLDEPGTVIPLTTSLEERISVICGSDLALVIDNRPYQISSTWDSNDFTDSYLVNLKDGSRKAVAIKLAGTPSVSPSGKYLTWYDHSDSDWYSYEIATGTIRNLTKGLDATFYDDEDDHPAPKPGLDRPHWLSNDTAFLLAEKYDIWRITPDGSKAECLTERRGRADDTQYRILGLKPSNLTMEQASAGIRDTYEPNETVYLSTYNRTTKENGFARILAGKQGIISTFTAPAGYSNIIMSRDLGTIAFLKGDARHSNDQYVTKDFWATETKLSAINPQQEDYNWCDVQLVHWTAYDGTKLDGLLYTPENLDKTKKYPMMVYFYEKNSQGLYKYTQPAPSRSVINFSFYASRGYVVFIPDIVYVDGHPGESAYNCICSGAEAMCDQFSFIDKDKMAIQGQSWGGYQTAYLVTRTDMFAAAGAGAPVGNMTSAYGGIRWESGMVRAMQYEHGQSRIGKSLWDDGGLELYIENSPVFHTENVTTPVLIMHNDNDGAVPWYQGIEFFMSLRRFNHPAWLLEYNNEAHNLVQRRNTKDLSIRLQQFFDHYLKGEPMPAWMSKGVPYSRKGQYFGFEYDKQK